MEALISTIISLPVWIIGIIYILKYRKILVIVIKDRDANLKTYSSEKLKALEKRVFKNIGAVLFIMSIILISTIIVSIGVKLILEN